jgi:hypothetical protein
MTFSSRISRSEIRRISSSFTRRLSTAPVSKSRSMSDMDSAKLIAPISADHASTRRSNAARLPRLSNAALYSSLMRCNRSWKLVLVEGVVLPIHHQSKYRYLVHLVKTETHVLKGERTINENALRADLSTSECLNGNISR